MSTPTSEDFKDGWQSSVLKEMTAFLRSHEAVRGAWIVGSLAAGKPVGKWSDIDLLVVVEDAAFQEFFPASLWAERWGTFVANEEQTDDQGGLSRLFFSNGIAMDISVSPSSALASIADWERRPFHLTPLPLFSRDPDLSFVLANVTVALWEKHSDREVAACVRKFYLWAASAVRQAVKGDLLMATHLANELFQICLDVELISRDNRAGTQIHKAGDMPLTARTNVPGIDGSPRSILGAVELACREFSKCAAELGHDCRERSAAVKDLLKLAAADL